MLAIFSPVYMYMNRTMDSLVSRKLRLMAKSFKYNGSYGPNKNISH